MAFTCGFFNSQNGDRKYNAEQMASIFDGLIKDGVYDTVGEIFAVTPGTGMQVLVGSGRAWFDHTWNNNDASYPLAITAADVSLPRYDAVVLETNHSDTVRTNRLRVVTGTPASNPVKPTMTSSANVKQHPLAYIKVTAGATAITQSMIQVVVGTSECPFVTGIIDTAEIDALFQQWNGEFNEWFENLKAQLSDNVVANLQGQIDQKVNKSDVATKADIEAGTSTTKWVTPKGLRDFSKDVGVYDQTTGKSIKLQTGVGLVGVKHNMSPMPFNGDNYIKPFWVYDHYIAYGGLVNTGTTSNVKNNPCVKVLDVETGIEYFTKTLNLLNTTASKADMICDPLCNGLGFFMGKTDGWGTIYDHENKNFIEIKSPNSAGKIYSKCGLTKNFAFCYYYGGSGNRTIYYHKRTGSSVQSFTLPTFDNNHYLTYAGCVNDYLYLAEPAKTSYSGVIPIRITKCDISNKTSSILLTSLTGLQTPNVNIIMVDETNAYFIITSSTGTCSKVLAFNYKSESWNLDAVLASTKFTGSESIGEITYLGTIGNRVYFYYRNDNDNPVYYFDKSDLQIYKTSIKDVDLAIGYGTLQHHVNEVKFDRYIIFKNGYIDSNDMTFHYFYPTAIPARNGAFDFSACDPFFYFNNDRSHAYGPIIHESIVGMVIFSYKPSNSNSSNNTYDSQYFGKIQPILLNNLA